MTPRTLASAAVSVVFGLALVAWLVSPLGAVSLAFLVVVVAWRFRFRGSRLFPQWMRQEILARDGAKCRWCGVDVHPESTCPKGGCPSCYHADHRKAWARGGRTTIANGLTTCAWCNETKGAKTPAEFRRAVLEKIRERA